jgi:hypothetical protein
MTTLGDLVVKPNATLTVRGGNVLDGSDDESDDFSLNPNFQDVVLTSLWCPPRRLVTFSARS